MEKIPKEKLELYAIILLLLSIIFPPIFFASIYGLAIFGLVKVLHKIGLSGRKRIFLSFLIFGIVTGIMVARTWPKEAGIYFNIFTVFFGDLIYEFSIQYLGDISSPQAHYTIPWFLRVPQVYVLASVVLWVSLGLLVQAIYNRKKG
jgi:hypothetical protein